MGWCMDWLILYILHLYLNIMASECYWYTDIYYTYHKRG